MAGPVSLHLLCNGERTFYLIGDYHLSATNLNCLDLNINDKTNEHNKINKIDEKDKTNIKLSGSFYKQKYFKYKSKYLNLQQTIDS